MKRLNLKTCTIKNRQVDVIRADGLHSYLAIETPYQSWIGDLLNIRLVAPHVVSLKDTLSVPYYAIRADVAMEVILMETYNKNMKTIKHINTMVREKKEGRTRDNEMELDAMLEAEAEKNR